MRLRGWLLASLLIASCGGKVAFDGLGQGSGSASASSSSSSSGTTSSSTTGSSSSTSSASSTTSTSSSSTSSSSGSSCPGIIEVGAACSDEGVVCPLPFGCCGGNGHCAAGVWTFLQNPCNEACIPCGPSLGCTTGAICVLNMRETYLGAECRQNPCMGGVSCGCAQPLCDDAMLQCTGVTPTEVDCSCPNC